MIDEKMVERVANAVHEVMRKPYLNNENDNRDWPVSLHEMEIAKAAIAAMKREMRCQEDVESKAEKQLGQDIYDELFDAWLTKLVGDDSVQAHCQRLNDKIMKHVVAYCRQHLVG